MTNIHKIPYIRVGTTYYKQINHPLASGDFIVRLEPWTKNTITQDEPSEVLGRIPKYDSFCTIPNHLDFKQIISNSYNRYHEFEHKPIQGEFSETKIFLNHISVNKLKLVLTFLQYC